MVTSVVVITCTIVDYQFEPKMGTSFWKIRVLLTLLLQPYRTLTILMSYSVTTTWRR